MTAPEISVIIPVRDRPRALARALASVRAQVDADFEVIVVDDASDRPVEAPGARIVRLDVNGGPARARNRGVEASRGRFLAFLDSDDIWLPNKLSAQRETIAGHGPATALVCGYIYHGRGEAAPAARMPEGASTPEAFASGCWYCPGSTLFVRREEFDAVGPFDESLRRLEDLDWALRFSLIGGRLACVPVTGAAIRPSRSQGLATVEAAAARLKAKFGSDGANALPPGAYRRLLAYLDVELAAVHRNEGRPGMTAVHLLRSLLRVPRLTVPLGRHWHPGPPPRAAEEAAYAALEADTD